MVSIVDALIERHEADQQNLLVNEELRNPISARDYARLQTREAIALARELERHAEAMYGYVKSDYKGSRGEDYTAGVLTAYEAFRKERGG